MNYGLREQVLDEIKELAKKYDIEQVILFGSRARGDYQERSDIDLAVSGGRIELFSVAVDEETSTLLKYDIVNLKGSVQRELLEQSGYDSAQTGSPRHIIKTAYQAGMVDDEELWLAALVSRNNVAHAYNKDVALDIIYATKEKYYYMFETLKKKLEDNWL